MLDLESHESDDAGGDDEQSDPNFWPNDDINSEHEDIEEIAAEMLGPIESLPEVDEIESDSDLETKETTATVFSCSQWSKMDERTEGSISVSYSRKQCFQTWWNCWT